MSNLYFSSEKSPLESEHRVDDLNKDNSFPSSTIFLTSFSKDPLR